MRLTLSVRSFHVPATPWTCACPPSLPSVPTSRATRVTSDANELSCAPRESFALHVDRDLPRQIALGHGGRHVGDVAHLAGQIAGHEVDAVRKVGPGPGDALDLRLPAQLALRTNFTGHASHLGSERIELV